MVKVLSVIVLLALAGCASMPQGSSSSCTSPTGACEAEFYMKAGA